MKRLFDVFIHEVIFDGERFLIVMKTTDESLDPEEGKKKKQPEKSSNCFGLVNLNVMKLSS